MEPEDVLLASRVVRPVDNELQDTCPGIWKATGASRGIHGDRLQLIKAIVAVDIVLEFIEGGIPGVRVTCLRKCHDTRTSERCLVSLSVSFGAGHN